MTGGMETLSGLFSPPPRGRHGPSRVSSKPRDSIRRGSVVTSHGAQVWPLPTWNGEGGR